MSTEGGDLLVIILGLGFTGQRLARRLLRRGAEVFAAVRGIERFHSLANAGLRLVDIAAASGLPRNATLAHLIPPLPAPENTALRNMVEGIAPARVVYVSSTSVYGDQIEVDERSPVKPNDERGRLRVEEEAWIQARSWSTLVLRAAAIYGPHRGVHAAMLAGKPPRGSGSGIVSRIHVEDLAAIIESGIFSSLEGEWPVADDAPCSTAEVAAWCAKMLKIESADPAPKESSVPGRNVNGSRILELLGVELEHPSWKTGIPASLAEEGSASIELDS